MTANTHLEHLEDYVLDNMDHCLTILNDLENRQIKEHYSIKYDGAPAIVFGTNPDNDKFFIGTKAVFNKTPKINYCARDIIENHDKSKGLMDKLLFTFAYLEKYKSKFPGIYQADLMYTADDIVYTRKVEYDRWDDEEITETLSFKANTIRYDIRDPHLLSDIHKSKLGLAIHTSYTSLTDPTPCFEPIKLGLSGDVIELPMSVYMSSKHDFGWIANRIRKANNTIDKDVYNEFAESEYPALFKMFENYILKTEGHQIYSFSDGNEFNTEGFVNWIIDRRTADIKRLKTPAAKLKHHTKMKADIEFLLRSDVQQMFKHIINIRCEVRSIKESIITFTTTRQKNVMQMYVGTENVGHEGYVISTPNWRFKAVRREVFSKLNFLEGKFK